MDDKKRQAQLRKAQNAVTRWRTKLRDAERKSADAERADKAARRALDDTIDAYDRDPSDANERKMDRASRISKAKSRAAQRAHKAVLRAITASGEADRHLRHLR